MHCMISEMRIVVRPRRAASLLALVFFTLLFLTSFAGRQCSFLMDHDALRKKREAAGGEQKETVVLLVHARMLNVKTNDYGSYDPSPSMDKPHFKLIPN